MYICINLSLALSRSLSHSLSLFLSLSLSHTHTHRYEGFTVADLVAAKFDERDSNEEAWRAACQAVPLFVLLY